MEFHRSNCPKKELGCKTCAIGDLSFLIANKTMSINGSSMTVLSCILPSFLTISYQQKILIGMI